MMSLHRLVMPILLGLVFLATTVMAQSGSTNSTAGAVAATGSYQAIAINPIPPNISSVGFAPMMMLAASRDHTLFSPIYSDYEDVDGDKKIDTTFKPLFVYYGYFDPAKCYEYVNEANFWFFKPVAGAGQDAGRYYCVKKWSGNFLNWATTTRLDIVRKMFYGGKRVLQSASRTILQGTSLSTDAHAFAKYYSGQDVADYTPFSVDDLRADQKDPHSTYLGLTVCTRDRDDENLPSVRMAKGNYSLWATLQGAACRWREGTVAAALLKEDQRFGAKLRAYYEHYAQDILAENARPPAHATVLPHADADGLPSGSAVAGLALQVEVCVNGLVGTESCQGYKNANGTDVLRPIGLLQKYGASKANEAPLAEFGLISGSYDKNLTGGLLRKNLGTINDELNQDGSFRQNGCSKDTVGIIKTFDCLRLQWPKSNYTKNTPSWVFPSDLKNGDFPSWGNPVGEMIAEALLYYQAEVKREPASGSEDASVGLSSVKWLDPMTDDLGVPGTTRKRGEVFGKSICRPMNIVAVSSSAVSYDLDDYQDSTRLFKQDGDVRSWTNKVGNSSHENINGTARSVGSVTGGFGEDCRKQDVVSLADVSGICPEAPATQGGFLSAGLAYFANTRAIRALDSVPGYSSDTSINGGRASKKLPPDLRAHVMRVKTYAAALAGGVARIDVDVGDDRIVHITPESAWDAVGGSRKALPGAMLTLKTIADNGVKGAFIVTWNDAQFGMDYDMDMVGFLAYEVRDGKVTITTDILNYSASFAAAHGFSIMGAVSTAERLLTHAGRGDNANGFDIVGRCAGLVGEVNASDRARRCSFRNGGMPTSSANLDELDGWNWPTKFNGVEINFSKENDPSITTVFKKEYAISGGGADLILKDPLYYAAKYGSFETGEREYHASAGDVSPSGSEVPGYILARNPKKLAEQLDRLFTNITGHANTTPSVSSTQLVSDSYKYVAAFNKDSLAGTVLAYKLKTDGTFPVDPTFSTGALLTKVAPETRQIITNAGQVGVPFTVGNLSSSYQSLLTGGVFATDKAGRLIDYLRGVRTDEYPVKDAPALFRTRDNSDSSLMGPVVNSSPWVQNSAAAQISDVTLPKGWASYRDFVATRVATLPPKILWVGSGDGMLHGFDALTGASLLSYVPSPVVGKLAAYYKNGNTGIQALVDGSPFTADVHLAGTPASKPPTGTPAEMGTASTAGTVVDDAGTGNKWATYLFESLGRGGRAVFALDVTPTLTPAQDKGAKPRTYSTFSQTDARNIFKWMFTSLDDADLGYVLNEPTLHPFSGQVSSVIRLNNDRFALMVPNGYQSSSGRPVLFLLYVDGPTDGSWKEGVNYRKLVANAATGTGNGMMGATWVDWDNNGTADVIYATDLHGQLWKFDVSDKTAGNWKSAFLETEGQPKPFFSATSTDGTVLPITTDPVVLFPKVGGAIVSFGTGQSIEVSDFPKTSVTHRFFSIWDRGSAFTTGVRALPTMSTLVQRTLTRDANGNVFIATSPPTSTTTTTTTAGSQAPATTTGATPTASDAGRTTDGQATTTPTSGTGTAAGNDVANENPVGANKDGWYFTFPAAGEGTATSLSEMLLSSPIAARDRVEFTTVWSTPGAAELKCSNSPDATLYSINPLTGLASGVLGTLSAADGGYPLIGRSSKDQKVLIVTDRTKGVTEGSQGAEGGTKGPGGGLEGTGGGLGDTGGGSNAGGEDGGQGGGQGGGIGGGGPPGGPPDSPPKDRCPPGTIAKRVIGAQEDARICVDASRARIQWREIRGLKTR